MLNAFLPPQAHPAPPAATRSLVATAYHHLRRDIIEGRLPPGSKLRVEHLKDSYGVGAATLREALALLVSDALVITQDQRGFFVKDMSMADFRDITRTRVLLECEALRQSIQEGDELWESRVVAAYHLLDKSEAKLAQDPIAGFNDWETHNKAFHQALFSACQSDWIRHFLNILYRQAERYRRLTITHRPIPRDVHAEHRVIYDAALARDTHTACQELAKHIQTTYDALQQLPESVVTSMGSPQK